MPASATGGWDAVLAIGTSEINALLREQYLQDGPTSPAEPVRLVTVDAGSELELLDVVLGPPELSFPAGAPPQTCEARMSLVRGWLFEVDPTAATVRSVVPVESGTSWIDGTLSLTKAKGGVDTVGHVHLDLAAGAYSPKIGGLGHETTTATALGLALATYFADRPSAFLLSTINKSSVPTALLPTDFTITTQPPSGGSGEGCVALPIKTNGPGGGQLPPNPIPSGDTAALLISGRVLFDGVLAPALTKAMSAIGTTYAAKQAQDGSWVVTGTGGTLGAGGIPDTYPGQEKPYSSDSEGNHAAVQLPVSASSLAVSGDTVTFTWTSNFSPYWSARWPGHGEFQGTGFMWVPASVETHQADMVAQFKLPYRVSVDPKTAVVSFLGTGSSTTVNPRRTYSWWQKVFSGDPNLPDGLRTTLAATLDAVLGQLKLPHIETLILQSLLFPSGQALRLTKARLPGDLALSGNVRPALKVSPGVTTVAPGESVQFSATLDGAPVTGVLWEVKPRLGQISADGLFKAPGKPTPHAVVVTAIDKANNAIVGHALVVLSREPAGAALTVAPAQVVLTAGQHYTLTVTDAAGHAVEATCTLSPKIGTLTEGLTTGTWTYAAPAQVTEAATVTVTATTSGRLTATAVVRLAASTQVKVTPSPATVQAGGSVALQADTGGLDDIRWAVYSTESAAGSLVPDGAGGVTYTAPASAAPGHKVTIIAYGHDEDAGLVGAGLARVTIRAPGATRADRPRPRTARI